MSDINQCVFTGRLTKQPEVSKTQSGLDIAKFSIACNRIKKQNEEKEQTDFINCIAWRNTALYLSKYCNRGDSLAVTGRYTVDSYKNREGATVYRNYITVDTVKKMASSQATQQPQPTAPAQPKNEYDGFDTGNYNAVDPDDLPF